MAQDSCSIEHLSTIKDKGVVVMKEMFTSLKGFQIVLQALTLCVSFLVFSNGIVEGPAKEIRLN